MRHVPGAEINLDDLAAPLRSTPIFLELRIMICLPSRFRLRVITGLCLALGCLSAAANAADPNGTWKWTFTTQGGMEIKISAELKLDGEKLTGKVSRGDQSTDISDGTFKDDEVAFNVVRERDGQKVTAKYKGKVEGDSLKGKIEFEFNGESRSFDWMATRDKK